MVFGFTSPAAPAAAPTLLGARAPAAPPARAASAAPASGRSLPPLRFSAERPSRRLWRAFAYAMPGTAR